MMTSARPWSERRGHPLFRPARVSTAPADIGVQGGAVLGDGLTERKGDIPDIGLDLAQTSTESVVVHVESLVDVRVWAELESVEGLELDNVGEKVGSRENQVCMVRSAQPCSIGESHSLSMTRSILSSEYSARGMGTYPT